MADRLIDRSAVGRRPTAMLDIAEALDARGNCGTPLAMLIELTGFDREKVKRVTRDMARRDRLRGLLIDAIELTETGRKWLEEVRFG